MQQSADRVTSFLQQLKERTSESHRVLEANLLSLQLMDSAVTLQQYARYLSLMHNVIKYNETYAFPEIEMIIDLEGRQKLPAIEKDLEGLHASPETSSYSPFANPLIIEAALAHSYVIEGSTLGGRVISKHINKYLGLDEHTGAAFFHGYGTDTGKRWQGFLHRFNSFVSDNGNEDAVIEAVQQTYKAIDDHFRKA